MSQYDLPNLFQFLHNTPEGGLRKMLVDNKPFTEGHFNLLTKILRNCDEKAFCEHFDKGDFPKIKMSPADQKLKEKFWGECIACFNSRGLLSPADKKAAA